MERCREDKEKGCSASGPCFYLCARRQMGRLVVIRRALSACIILVIYSIASKRGYGHDTCVAQMQVGMESSCKVTHTQKALCPV